MGLSIQLPYHPTLIPRIPEGPELSWVTSLNLPETTISAVLVDPYPVQDRQHTVLGTPLTLLG